MEIAPPNLCTDSSECRNSSSLLVGSNKTELFSTQDRELVSILVDLENTANNSEANAIGKTRLFGHFCSDTVSNLSWKVLTDNEIKVLEKGIDYAPIQSKINEPELRNDFEEFCRRMHLQVIYDNDKSYHDLLNFSNDLSIHQRHLSFLAIDVYKSLMNMNPIANEYES